MPMDASSAAVCVALAATLISFLWAALSRGLRRKEGRPGHYSARDFVAHEDLVDPAVRGDHLAFNEHLHKHFRGQRFVPVRGEEGCFLAFEHSTCKEVLSDAAAFSSNPFPDGRLVALSTMSKADHARVLRCVHSHYTPASVQQLEERVRGAIARCTDNLESSGDAMQWAKRIHMASTLLRLGVEPVWELVDEVVGLNDAMVALVAPLGGVGPRYSDLPAGQSLRVVAGLLRSCLPMAAMLWHLGPRCTWEIVRPDVTLLWPPRRPRMGLWSRPELLPLVPRYFLSLQALLASTPEGPLAGMREAMAKGELTLAEALTLMVQLMVNMTSANALGSLLFRLGTERAVSDRVAADVDGLAQAFVQEVLRLDAPLQRNPRRVLQTVGKWAGSPLRAGDEVLVLLGAANMDPAVFDSPVEFRLDRPEKALSFGSGLHYCLGSNLVKMEMRLALRCVLERFDSVEVGDYERLVDVDVGNWGFRRLHVTLRGKK